MTNPEAESTSPLTDMADRLFGDLSDRRDAPFETIWPQLQEAGFCDLLLPEADGGFGGNWTDLFLVQRLAGLHALPAPVGEQALASHLLRGLEAPGGAGLSTIAAHATGTLGVQHFTGQLSGIPWGRHAATVIAELDGALFAVATAGCEIQAAQNMAGEPRDNLEFSGAAALALQPSADLFSMGALLRVSQIAGALQSAFLMSIEYSNQRIQFGKPIAKFQAVQQSLAVFAEAVAATSRAGQSAASARERGDAWFDIAAAKLRADMAVDLGASIAHQIHGAIGFTRDHKLHHFTRRLHAWRSEFGNDRYWAELLGRKVTAHWQADLWAGLTRLDEG